MSSLQLTKNKLIFSSNSTTKQEVKSFDSDVTINIEQDLEVLNLDFEFESEVKTIKLFCCTQFKSSSNNPQDIIVAYSLWNDSGDDEHDDNNNYKDFDLETKNDDNGRDGNIPQKEGFAFISESRFIKNIRIIFVAGDTNSFTIKQNSKFHLSLFTD